MSETQSVLGAKRLEVALDEIVRDTDAGNADRRLATTSLHDAREPVATHQPLYAFATDLDSVRAEVAVDPRRPIRVAARRVQLADPLEQQRVRTSALRRRPGGPGVEAGAADAEHPAERLDRMVGPLRGD